MNIKNWFNFTKNKTTAVKEKVFFTDISLDNNIDLYNFYTELYKLNKNYKVDIKNQKKHNNLIGQNINNLNSLYSDIKSELIDVKSNYQKQIIKNTAEPLINILDKIYNLKKIADTVQPKNILSKLFFKQKNYNSLIEGFNILENTIIEKLKKYDIEKINAVNQEFNPEFMEVIETVSNKKFKNNIVVEEIETGFKTYDKVIRNAKVIVNILNK
jgi:molecular chaperone GrpE